METSLEQHKSRFKKWEAVALAKNIVAGCGGGALREQKARKKIKGRLTSIAQAKRQPKTHKGLEGTQANQTFSFGFFSVQWGKSPNRTRTTLIQ